MKIKLIDDPKVAKLTHNNYILVRGQSYDIPDEDAKKIMELWPEQVILADTKEEPKEIEEVKPEEKETIPESEIEKPELEESEKEDTEEMDGE